MDSIGDEAESDFANEHFAEEFSNLNSLKEKSAYLTEKGILSFELDE